VLLNIYQQRFLQFFSNLLVYGIGVAPMVILLHLVTITAHFLLSENNMLHVCENEGLIINTDVDSVGG
jgi:hypothetical protein